MFTYFSLLFRGFVISVPCNQWLIYRRMNRFNKRGNKVPSLEILPFMLMHQDILIGEACDYFIFLNFLIFYILAAMFFGYFVNFYRLFFTILIIWLGLLQLYILTLYCSSDRSDPRYALDIDRDPG